MNLLTGEYNNSIDEKGRVAFPTKLKNAISGNSVIVTKGLEHCLWLFTIEEWEKFQTKLMSNSSMMKSRTSNVIRHFIGPAQEIEFDKSGRLSIPQSLRDYAKLTKDCTVLGIAKYMELWDLDSYNEFQAETEDSFREAAEEFNDINF